ncbi:Peroxidase 5 [Nymphaea thermarum]|nr:Peroxidase 5 [Nymphaea thermarum]
MSAVLLFFSIVFVLPLAIHGDLRVGFYQETCPLAEAITRGTIFAAAVLNPGIVPGLVRLHFHDCFVRGCDASILLDSPTEREGDTAEKDSPFNGASLRGLEVLDEIKAQLEIACPGTVSCADILAFAARDAASFAGIPNYEVPSGRLDGRISLADEVPHNLPMPFYNLSTLANLFASKGLSLEDLVVLSGAHSIGRAHCPSFHYRLYHFSPTQPQDPSLDPSYANYLKSICPPTVKPLDESPAVPLDAISSTMMPNTFYVALTQHKGLLGTDQVLMSSMPTRKMVRRFAHNPFLWPNMFADAMVKVGRLTTNEPGEVRKYCRSING